MRGWSFYGSRKRTLHGDNRMDECVLSQTHNAKNQAWTSTPPRATTTMSLSQGDILTRTRDVKHAVLVLCSQHLRSNAPTLVMQMTLHTALPYYTTPYYIDSNPPNVTTDTPTDVVFLNYLGEEIIPSSTGYRRIRTTPWMMFHRIVRH
ncbi:hypothetical protein BDR03DRAFT_561068 [Suillus americanus]|nr:hypothetical protein BDR03DRAFT_561068 [Suillus americanus]